MVNAKHKVMTFSWHENSGIGEERCRIIKPRRERERYFRNDSGSNAMNRGGGGGGWQKLRKNCVDENIQEKSSRGNE